MFNLFQKQAKSIKSSNSIIFGDEEPEWSNKDYITIARESYCKNVIAHRCISMIAKSVASIPVKLFINKGGKKKQSESHDLLDVIKQPNPFMSGKDFIEEFM